MWSIYVDSVCTTRAGIRKHCTHIFPTCHPFVHRGAKARQEPVLEEDHHIAGVDEWTPSDVAIWV